MINLMLGDCLDRLKELEADSVDSVVCDPPYGLNFMGKKWDYDVPSREIWEECLRVLKPGGYLLAFAGTRTQHRMACRIEDAGFEIRDMIAWVYGSGFPKSLNISKALDKLAGAEREVIGINKNSRPNMVNIKAAVLSQRVDAPITAPNTDEAKQWDGWGTALKPSMEPITVARKPLSEKTVAANVLEHGTGGINIDGCRVEYEDTKDPATNPLYRTQNGYAVKVGSDSGTSSFSIKADGGEVTANPLGRWPANFIHDGGDQVLSLFPVTKSGGGDKHGKKGSTFMTSTDWESFKGTSIGGDEGSAARFFYCAKSSKSDRNYGLPDGVTNKHVTVKPIALMQYLTKLVTPPSGKILDPFMGSGSTGVAAVKEYFRFIGVEKDEESFSTAKARIEQAYLEDLI